MSSNALETAIKYDVPTHKTCEDLDWKMETLYTWIGDYLCRDVVIRDGGAVGVCVLDGTNVYEYEEGKPYPAPQIHEIKAYLPKQFTSYNLPSDDILEFAEIRGEIGYFQFELDDNDNLDIVSSCYTLELTENVANDYANLYLKLRKAGLLPEKGGAR